MSDVFVFQTGVAGPAGAAGADGAGVPSGGTNKQRLRKAGTTAYVTEWASFGRTTSSTAFSASDGDVDGIIVCTAAGAVALTIPAGTFALGQSFRVVQSGAGVVTITSDGTTTINARVGAKTAGQHAIIEVVCTGTNTFSVGGDSAA